MTSPFAPLALSKRLAEAGCVSESEYWYVFNKIVNKHFLLRVDDPMHSSLGPNETCEYRAFRPEDFLGPTQAARENCKRIWGYSSKTTDNCDCMVAWDGHRHEAMDQSDVESFWKYIEETGVKK